MNRGNVRQLLSLLGVLSALAVAVIPSAYAQLQNCADGTAGDDTILCSGEFDTDDVGLDGREGSDSITVSGNVNGNINGDEPGNGADTITVRNGADVEGTVDGNAGIDSLTITENAVVNDIDGGSEADKI